MDIVKRSVMQAFSFYFLFEQIKENVKMVISYT